MSIHYIYDAETAPINDSKLLGVVLDTNETDRTGGFIVRIPEGLDFDVPSNQGLSSTLNNKYAALLAYYPGHTYIVYDDFLDGTGLDAATASGCRIGGRNTCLIEPSGTVDTVTVALASSPVTAVITWELFTQQLENDKTGRATFTYEEQASSGLQVQASFDGGSNFQAVYDGQTTNIVNTGNSLVLRFSNVGARRWIGSWAVIY